MMMQLAVTLPLWTAAAVANDTGIDWRDYVSRADMVWNSPTIQTLSWLQSPFVRLCFKKI